jgi:hypothetical protein
VVRLAAATVGLVAGGGRLDRPHGQELDGGADLEVAERDVLVAVHLEDAALAARAAGVLRELGAERVHLVDGRGVPLPPPDAGSPPTRLRPAVAVGRRRHRRPGVVADPAAPNPPVGNLFAAFLGSNRMGRSLDPTVLGALPPDRAAYLTGKTFFPRVVSGPFKAGLTIAFGASLAMCLVAAGASWLRGR